MPYTLVAVSEIRRGIQGRSKRVFLRFLRDLMSKFLRKVHYKTNWDPHGEFTQYLPPGEAPADALQDLATSDNALSVWEIDDEETNLDRVLAAIVSRGSHVQKIDYLIVDSTRLQELSLKIEKATGETHDNYANKTWHYDVIHLSTSNLSRLANTIFRYGKMDRKTDSNLTQLLKKSVDSGFIDEAKLLPDLQARLRRKSL